MFIRFLLSFLFLLAWVSPGYAQLEGYDQTYKMKRILENFVPQKAHLRRLTGIEIAELSSKNKFMGISRGRPHGDQRYMEVRSDFGRVAYKEGRFLSVGIWFVENDQLCFRYDEQSEPAHCFYEYAYGSCTISYNSPIEITDNHRGLKYWNSVEKVAPSGFDWPNAPIEDVEMFNCHYPSTRQSLKRKFP